jgi:siderophore synthetase component
VSKLYTTTEGVGVAHKDIPDSIKRKIAKHHFKRGDIALAKKIMLDVMQTSKRDATRQRAAQFVLDHEMRLQEYESPPDQQLNHNLPTKIVIESVAPKPRNK